MGTVDIYRQIVQQVLAAYADIPYAYGDVHTEVVCDRKGRPLPAHDRRLGPGQPRARLSGPHRHY